jgi:hypothetical protein
MAIFAWFTLLATLALYYRFILILFEHINESKILKVFYSFVGIFSTFVLAKLISMLLGFVQINIVSDEAIDYVIWFGITIGLIVIYEAIFRIIIIRRDFQEIQLEQQFEELNSLMYKVNEYVRRGDWNRANETYSKISVLDINDEMAITLRCIEFAEQCEKIGDLKAAQFWYEKAGLKNEERRSTNEE